MKKIIILILCILAVATLVGCADKTISLPDIAGMTLEEAENFIKDREEAKIKWPGSFDNMEYVLTKNSCEGLTCMTVTSV